jgi:hypothetical protein
MGKKDNSGEDFAPMLRVDFNKVNMNSKTDMWTDDMSKSVFNLQPAFKVGVNGHSKPTTRPLNDRAATLSRKNPFANKFR